MSLTLNTLSPKTGSRVKKFRIGRGQSSGRGKTAGRGTKGQRSRTGGRKKLKLKGMKQMLLGFPKMRGFQSRFEKATTIPVSRLEAFAAGEIVSLVTLKNKRLVRPSAKTAKIVGTGSISKKLIIQGLAVSEGAKTVIEAAGGSISKVKKTSRGKNSKVKNKKKTSK